MSAPTDAHVQQEALMSEAYRGVVLSFLPYEMSISLSFVDLRVAGGAIVKAEGYP